MLLNSPKDVSNWETENGYCPVNDKNCPLNDVPLTMVLLESDDIF